MNPISSWFPETEDGGRVKRQVSTLQNALVDPQLIWSDDRNAALDTLQVDRYFFNP